MPGIAEFISSSRIMDLTCIQHSPPAQIQNRPNRKPGKSTLNPRAYNRTRFERAALAWTTTNSDIWPSRDDKQTKRRHRGPVFGDDVEDIIAIQNPYKFLSFLSCLGRGDDYLCTTLCRSQVDRPQYNYPIRTFSVLRYTHTNRVSPLPTTPQTVHRVQQTILSPIVKSTSTQHAALRIPLPLPIALRTYIPNRIKHAAHP